MLRSLILALVLAIAAPHAAETAPEMIEEDVVRRVLAGTAPAVIIAEIERREVRFDISDEMLDELELAGVPRGVIDAMVSRQRRLDAERTPAIDVADPVVPDVPRLRIRLGADETPTELTIDREVSPELEAVLQLVSTTEPRKIDDLAVFLACRRAEHVPDHWRGASPLGRDFLSMPRHRMLAFVAGAGNDERRLTLELPAWLEAELNEEAPHELSLGVAVLVNDRYYRVADIELEGVDPDSLEAPLAARITTDRRGRLNSLELRWLAPDAEHGR